MSPEGQWENKMSGAIEEAAKRWLTDPAYQKVCIMLYNTYRNKGGPFSWAWKFSIICVYLIKHILVTCVLGLFTVYNPCYKLQCILYIVQAYMSTCSLNIVQLYYADNISIKTLFALYSIVYSSVLYTNKLWTQFFAGSSLF